MIKCHIHRFGANKIVAISCAVLLFPLLFNAIAYDMTLVYVKRTQHFVFDRFNRSYHDLKPQIAPIRRGPLTVQLSSPRHVITLRRHSLELEPERGGNHFMRLKLEFLGEGNIVADLDLGGMKNRFEDEVVIPLQQKSVNGRVRLKRGDHGYVVIPISMPETVELEIRSRLATRLIDWCGQVSWLSLNIMDCTGLDRQLSKVSLPLPRQETYFISDTDLTPNELKELETYLRASEKILK